MLALESSLEGEPNIKHVLTLVGEADSLTGNNAATHTGRVTVEFVDYKDRLEPSMVTIDRIREKLSSMPGVEIVVDYQQSGPPVGQAVDIELSGPDANMLGSIAADIREAIRLTEGLVDLKDSYVKSKPEIRINVDREKAALLGLSTATIATVARGAISGIKVGVYREGDDEYDIIVRLPEDQRQSVDDIKNLQIPASGGYIPLSSVADVELSAGFGQINRVDYKRVVNITANASEERGGAAVLADVKTILQDYQLPAGYSIKYTGEDEEQMEAQVFLVKAFSIAIFLILMVLLIEFNSVAQTLIILATVLLSIGGVFWGLLITQTTFGIIMSGIGIISLAGIVVNNGIIMIDYTNKLIIKGYAMRDAIVRAGVIRFRPVMLTAVTSILGMLPMSIGYGINFAHLRIEKGAEMSQWWVSMANAIIFGLAFATMLTLIIVPVLYSFIGSSPLKWIKWAFSNGVADRFASLAKRKPRK
jgi:multidrug efflux pump subunit AcrB